MHNMTKHGQQENSGNALDHRLKMHFLQHHRTVSCLKSLKEIKLHLQCKYLINYEETWHLLLDISANCMWFKLRKYYNLLKKLFEVYFTYSPC